MKLTKIYLYEDKAYSDIVDEVDEELYDACYKIFDDNIPIYDNYLKFSINSGVIQITKADYKQKYYHLVIYYKGMKYLGDVYYV